MCITTSSTAPPQISTAPVATPGTTTPSSRMPGLPSDVWRHTLRLERQMVDNEARHRTASIPAAFAFVALAVAACGGTGPETAGVDPVVAGTLHVCSQCHGPGGRSTTASTFPRLAGQQ